MIGVFDSGVGGLSVHRALTRKMPSANFIYLADQAHTPYGARHPDEIVALTRAGCERLFYEGASLIVLACNTAAAIALHPLQQHWLPEFQARAGRPLNVLGLIVPTIESVTGLAWGDVRKGPHARDARQAVGVFATPGTVRSQVYATEIHKRRPDMRVEQEACPDLAQMIESGAGVNILREAIAQHVGALTSRIGDMAWRGILGCTHYEIVAPLFFAALPPEIRLIHQPTATADALARYLARHPEYAAGTSGIRRFITTGRRSQSPLAQEFWGDTLAFEMPLAA